MTARRFALALTLARAFTLTLSLTASAGLLSVTSCSSPSGNELFAKNGISSSGAATNLGGSTSASAGTDSVASHAETGGGGSDAVGGRDAVGGSGGVAGSEQALGGSAGQAMQTPVPVIESCDMLDNAVTSELNGHCYRVSSEELTFVAARDACHAAGGHLLTVDSDEENDFARDLHDGEHWLGATDGLADSKEGVGSYSWVNEEEWAYTDWREGQPNAFATDCPGEDSGAGCYEHCAYQTDEGDWIDRSCWHSIVAICEWEPTAE